MELPQSYALKHQVSIQRIVILFRCGKVIIVSEIYLPIFFKVASLSMGQQLKTRIDESNMHQNIIKIKMHWGTN